MTGRPVTLGTMRESLGVRIAHAADAVLSQGADWDAVWAYLAERLDDEDDLDHAYELARCVHRLFIVAFPGPVKAENGYDLVRQLRETVSASAVSPPLPGRGRRVLAGLRVRVGA